MLEIANASVGYGNVPVLEGLSGRFERGRLTAVVGVNGCGKSTLLRAMAGLLPLMEGEVRMDGRSISAMQQREIARRVAYVPQGRSIPDMTVGQLVLHGRFPHLAYPRRYGREDRVLAAAAMERVGILHLEGSPLATLSGGMRQTAYIAMALARDADYVLLDEPTTYLDISHQLHLMELLRGLARDGKGIVAVMHDLPLAFDFSDEITLLDRRSILWQLPPAEACRTPDPERVFGVAVAPTPDGRRYVYDYTK